MKKIIVLMLVLATYKDLFSNDLLTKQSVNNYFTTLLDWPDQYWSEGRSTALIENGYDRLHYEQVKIWDNDLSTAWVEGVKGEGIGEWVMTPVNGNYQSLYYDNEIATKKISLRLNIFNGFCKNTSTFKNNNRVKKAKIRLYEVPLRLGQHETVALEEPYITFETYIELVDSNTEQKFYFNFYPKASYSDGFLCLFIQLTILEVYPGEKYNDTCISELHATADVIKEKKPEVTKRKKSFFRKDKE